MWLAAKYVHHFKGDATTTLLDSENPTGQTSQSQVGHLQHASASITNYDSNQANGKLLSQISFKVT
jgi:hypothetical protein